MLLRMRRELDYDETAGAVRAGEKEVPDDSAAGNGGSTVCPRAKALRTKSASLYA
jgi:hypothetical protein